MEKILKNKKVLIVIGTIIAILLFLLVIIVVSSLIIKSRVMGTWKDNTNTRIVLAKNNICEIERKEKNANIDLSKFTDLFDNKDSESDKDYSFTNEISNCTWKLNGNEIEIKYQLKTTIFGNTTELTPVLKGKFSKKYKELIIGDTVYTKEA